MLTLDSTTALWLLAHYIYLGRSQDQSKAPCIEVISNLVSYCAHDIEMRMSGSAGWSYDTPDEGPLTHLLRLQLISLTTHESVTRFFNSLEASSGSGNKERTQHASSLAGYVLILLTILPHEYVFSKPPHQPSVKICHGSRLLKKHVL